MESDDDFEVQLGRPRTRGAGRKYLHRVLAARGGLARVGHSRFGGSRVGRGAGVGRVLARRDRLAAFRKRRVIIKARVVRLAGNGLAGARAHLRYIQRDGTTREGTPGDLYGEDVDRADGKAFFEKAAGDRHQFRFIVSPEDGAEYGDLRPLTRRLMTRVEEDLGTRLDWVAVDHFNTGHPHTHIIVRGTDEHGRDLIIARDYIQQGMRERAAELVDLDLGPRADRAIEDRLRAEVEQERLTSIDRSLLKSVDGQSLVSAAARNAFDQTIRAGRLRKLERLGLARQVPGGRWSLSPHLRETLTKMGERGDIIRTMQRALAARGRAMVLADQAIFDPAAPDSRPLIGRLLERGLSDEFNDRHYLLVEATDGRTHYVDVGRDGVGDAPETGSLVRIAPVVTAIREVDRTVAAIAAANGGQYDIDVHLQHDPTATEAFARTHVRRLEAIRRKTGGVGRQPDGSWTIAADHLDRVAVYEAVCARDRPVTVTMLSSLSLEKLVDLDAATWLDRELVAGTLEAVRDAGFGAEINSALAARRQWLIVNGFAEVRDGRTHVHSETIDVLRRRELLRVAGQLSEELGLRFTEARSGDRVEGRLARAVEMASGRHALVERSRDFTLVPWRPVLERHVGRRVFGIMRENGISWTLGRGRSGPSIS